MRKLLACVLILLFIMPACLAQTGVFRALSAGIVHYDDGRVRGGGLNSTQGVYDALSRAFGNSGGFISTMGLDFTKDELLYAISETFREAQGADVSLVYINAHGGAQSGTSWIETREGERLTAQELERTLRGIPGTVILLIDCCNSGGFIGEDSFEEHFAMAFRQNAFASDKYLVCASCTGEENSYRVASKNMEEENLSTAFARALCEGLGWDLVGDRSTSLKADADRDRRVTFAEIGAYVKRRCMYYLSASSKEVQTVCIWPDTGALILASRAVDIQ